MKRWIGYAGIGMVLGAVTFRAGEAQSQDRHTMLARQDREAPSDVDASLSSAPSAEEDQMLLSGKVDHGGYGAPHMKLTTVAGQAGLLLGGEGAWIIGHSFLLGGGGYGLATSADAPEQARSPSGTSSLTLGYGGVRIGYIIAPHDLLHVSASLLIGGGGVSVLERNGSTTRTFRSASVFALEPDVALEVNISRMVRAGIDVSYRYLSDSRIPGLPASKIGGPAAGVLVAFGWF